MKKNQINDYHNLGDCLLTNYMPRNWPGFLKWSNNYITGGRTLIARAEIEAQDFEVLENNYQKILLCTKGTETCKKLLKAFYDLRLDLVNGGQGSHQLPGLAKELSDIAEELKNAFGSFLKLEKEFSAKFRAMTGVSQADLDILGLVPSVKPKPDYLHEQAVIDKGECISGEVLAHWVKGTHDAMTFRWREFGGESWHNAGAAVSSPGYLDVKVEAKPRIVEISGRYIKSNKPVGEWSEPFQVMVKTA